MTTTAPEAKPSLAPLRVKGCCNPVAPPLPDARADELSALYKALADPTRIQILHILATATEPVCVCDFTAAFDLGQPTISHHLATLREAGIVTASSAASGRSTASTPRCRRRLEPRSRSSPRQLEGYLRPGY